MNGDLVEVISCEHDQVTAGRLHQYTWSGCLNFVSELRYKISEVSVCYQGYLNFDNQIQFVILLTSNIQNYHQHVHITFVYNPSTVSNLFTKVDASKSI